MTIKQKKGKGVGTIMYARDFPADGDLSVAGLTDQAAVAAELASNGWKLLGCMFGVQPSGFSRGTADEEACLEDSDRPVYDAATEYNQGDVVQPAGSIPGTTSNVCYKALNSGTLSAPPSADWAVTDCGCARPTVTPGDLEPDVASHEISFARGSDVDAFLRQECATTRQFLIIYAGQKQADGSVQMPMETFTAYVQSYSPQTVGRDDNMKADFETVRLSEVVVGEYTQPAPA